MNQVQSTNQLSTAILIECNTCLGTRKQRNCVQPGCLLLFLSVCVEVHTCVPLPVSVPEEPRGIRSPGAGAIGNCEPPENQT